MDIIPLPDTGHRGCLQIRHWLHNPTSYFGVVVVKKSNKDRIGRSVSYIGSMDTTISGSRNALTPLFLWYALSRMGKSGLVKRAMDSLSIAEYAVEKLSVAGIPAWRNKHALTVVFPKPHDAICHKWQLASENDTSHLICMPGVTKGHIDAFVADYIDAVNEPGKYGIESMIYGLN